MSHIFTPFIQVFPRIAEFSLSISPSPSSPPSEIVEPEKTVYTRATCVCVCVRACVCVRRWFVRKREEARSVFVARRKNEGEFEWKDFHKFHSFYFKRARIFSFNVTCGILGIVKQSTPIFHLFTIRREREREIFTKFMHAASRAFNLIGVTRLFVFERVLAISIKIVSTGKLMYASSYFLSLSPSFYLSLLFATI